MEYLVTSFNYRGECETWLNMKSAEGWELFEFRPVAHANGKTEIFVVLEREPLDECDSHDHSLLRRQS